MSSVIFFLSLSCICTISPFLLSLLRYLAQFFLHIITSVLPILIFFCGSHSHFSPANPRYLQLHTPSSPRVYVRNGILFLLSSSLPERLMGDLSLNFVFMGSKYLLTTDKGNFPGADALVIHAQLQRFIFHNSLLCISSLELLAGFCAGKV